MVKLSYHAKLIMVSASLAFFVFLTLIGLKFVPQRLTLTASFQLAGYFVLQSDRGITPFRKLQDIEDSLKVQFNEINLDGNSTVNCYFSTMYSSNKFPRPLLDIKCLSDDKASLENALKLVSEHMKSKSEFDMLNVQRRKALAKQLLKFKSENYNKVFEGQANSLSLMLEYQQFLEQIKDIEKYKDYEIEEFKLLETFISGPSSRLGPGFMVLLLIFSTVCGAMFFFTERTLAHSEK